MKPLGNQTFQFLDLGYFVALHPEAHGSGKTESEMSGLEKGDRQRNFRRSHMSFLKKLTKRRKSEVSPHFPIRAFPDHFSQIGEIGKG